MPNLYLSNMPAPYRMDLYRSLAQELDCVICFEEVREGVPGLDVRPWSLRTLPKLIRQVRPSIVFVPEFSAAAIVALRLRKSLGFKVVSFCDDSMDMIRGHDFGWKHHLARRIVPKRLDNIILHSPEVAEWYRKHYGKGLVMPILADERRIRPELERVLPLSEQMRPSEKPVVAFVGRLVGLKNVPTLIRAFEPLKDRATLVIIGDGPDRASLEAMAPEALFTGMLSGDELLAWYNLIDILVLPSTQEAYGAVTGEALMAGAKVIVSRKAGSSSLVRVSFNGYDVDPMDVPMMTEYLSSLLDGFPDGRPLTLRANLHPDRFATSFATLLKELR